VLDGAEVDCGLVANLLDKGNAKICPNNNCSGVKVAANGTIYRYFPAGTYVTLRGKVDDMIYLEVILLQTGRFLRIGKTDSDYFGAFLDLASDFSAGAGDFLSFGLTEKFRQHYGYNDVVDKQSGAYAAGFVTGAAVGGATGALTIGKAVAGLETKIAIHGAHHVFNLIGQVPHIQIIWWIAGEAGSDQTVGSPIRIPLTPWWPQRP
jgi:hypothetical protein